MPSLKLLAEIYDKNILSRNVLKEASGPGNLEKDGLLTVNTPPVTYKLGKYLLVNNDPAVKLPYSQAVSKKYISGATLKSLKEFEDVGFVFNDAVFASAVFTPGPNSWSRSGPYLSGISTIILGKDPKGEDIAYVRSASLQEYAKIYFTNYYGKVRDIYQNYAPAISPEQLMDLIAQETNATLIKNGDGTVDINGNLNVLPSVRIGKAGSHKIEHIPLKIRKITGTLYFSLNNFKNFPDEVTESTNIDLNKDSPSIDFSPLYNHKTKNLHITKRHRNSKKTPENLIDLSLLPPVYRLYLHGVPVNTTDLRGIKLLQGSNSRLDLNNMNLNNLEGLPEEYEGVIDITDYLDKGAGDRAAIKSLKGMPKIVRGDVIINSKMPYSFFDLPETITGNLSWFLGTFNKHQAMQAYIGSRVQGSITVQDPQALIGTITIDKRYYTKGWVDAQQQNISKHDVDITSF